MRGIELGHSQCRESSLKCWIAIGIPRPHIGSSSATPSIKLGQALCLINLDYGGSVSLCVFGTTVGTVTKVKQAHEASFTLDTVGTVDMFGL